MKNALSNAVSEAQLKHILGDDIYLICAAGVYSDTDADLCMNVNYHGTRNTIEQIQQTFKSNLRCVTIIGSDQSYFDKNSQRNYGTQDSSKEAPYMASKQALRRYFDELYAGNSASWMPCFIAPATVITPLTLAVFADVENSQNPRQLVYENWERENEDIPDGLLHPLNLAYVIVNATVRNPQRITHQLVDCIHSGRGILLDGGLNQQAGIIQKSDRFTRFSLTRENVVFAFFIIFGLILIVIGGICKWNWIRNYWFRLTHLFAIVLVAIESWCGVICPLTDWEMNFRELSGQGTYDGDFIAHWLQRLLYFDAPAWVFILCYSSFGLVVIGCWIVFRPSRW